MPSWFLPASAAAFWLGLLTGKGLPPQVGGPLLALAVANWIAVLTTGRGRLLRSRRLLEAAGLGSAAEVPASPRERVLLAAGFPVGEQPSADAHPGRRRISALVLGFLVAGAGWYALHGHARDLGPLEGRYVSFRGTAASDVRRYDWGWALEARIESITLEGRTWPMELRAWVSGNDDALPAQAGDGLFGEGRIEAVAEGGFGAYLASRGVEATVRSSALEVAGSEVSPPLAAANAARRALREGISRALEDREAGLLLGLAIGDTVRLDPEIEEDFRASGLSHLLAVSGSNVATFLAPVLALATRLRARPRVRTALGVLAVLFFALVTRWEPSVLRASAMAAIALVGMASGRPRSTAPALGAAVLVLLVADPALVGSLGFELSVAATAGIAAMAGPIASRLRGLPRPLAVAVGATAAAQAAVTPLLLLRFGVVPTVTLLANVLAFPAVAPALLVGVPAGVIGTVWPALGAALGRVAAVPLGYLVAVADRTARFPLPSLTAEGPFIPVAAALLVMLLSWRLRRGRRPIAALVAVVVVTAVAWSVPLGASREALSVTFLDVGQGDAALIRSPGGATILVDAGPEESTVAADLARLGVRRIDLAVATHAHADHVAGFPAVLARFPVSLLLDPGCPGDSPVYERFLEAVEAEDVPVRHPRGGDGFTVGDLSVRVLGPDRCSAMGEANDDSIVLLVSLGRDSVLMTGDAEIPSQQDMLEDRDPVEADVLKVPHHGGDTSDPAFLEATGAAVAVVSTGPNTYGHPNPGVLEVLRTAGMSVYRTDIAGEITVRFTEDGAVAVGSEAG